jgi:adenosine deaminase
MALDFTARQATQNIVYTEAFFMPCMHLAGGLCFEAIKQGMEAGFKEAEALHGVKIRLLFNLPRGLDLEMSLKTLELIEKYKWDRVLGIDLAGKETRGDIAPRADIFAKARSLGLKTVAHAGEFSPSSQVAETLNLLKPHRIGHGLSAIEDENLIEILIKNEICLEMAPTSNLLLGAVSDISEHPLPQFLQKGVNVVLNSDDPAFFKTSLNRELDLVHNEMQVSETDLERLIKNGFEQAFGF